MEQTFDIQKRKKGDVIILDIIGDLTIGEPEQLLKDTVSNLSAKKQVRLVLNLQNVEFIDSSGVGALVKSYTTLTSQGGQMKLIHAGKMVKQTLKITGLLGIFNIYEDEADAVAAF